MAKGNYSAVSEFILLGLTGNPELQATLFGVFLVIYLASVLGNLGLIVLIQVSPQLHTPMYSFSQPSGFYWFFFTSSVTSNTLVNFLCEAKSITFFACAIQVCRLIIFVVCEQYLLIRAYDRYVAICNLYCMLSACLKNSAIGSLLAHIFMDSLWVLHRQSQHSSCLSVARTGSTTSTVMTFPWLRWLALTLKELLLLTIAGFTTLCSLLIVIISYVFILFAILRIHSAEGRQIAFSTCVSHLTSIFYATIIFMYLLPNSNHSLNTGKFASVFYVVVIPVLNPLIYSLRNQEVKNALKRIIEKFHLTIR